MAMPRKSRVTWLIFFITLWTFTNGQEDSLRSALNAIDRRQRDLSEYDDGEFGYPLERPDDLAFLKASASYSPERSYEKNPILGRPLINYIDDDRYNTDDVNTRISSAFRERIEEDNQKQLEELARDILSNPDNREMYGNDNDELLREYWEKYRRPYEDTKIYSKYDKRDYYPQFGLDAIGLRKRNSNNHYGGEEVDNLLVHHHVPRDEEYDDEDYDDNYQMNYLRKRYRQRENKLNMIRQMYSNPYSQVKRFPVAKRSSNYMPLEATHEQKRSVRKQTDPKVEKELSNIFGNKEGVTPTKAPATTTKVITPKKEVPENKQKLKLSSDEKKTKKPANKEEVSAMLSASEKPLQIKKKSIDWSDYFGLDRRKKSERNDLDKEWLIERYHKSIALPAKKRTAEIPLSSFRNHEEPSKKEYSDDVNEEKYSPEEQKIDDMDSKLKMLEDKIVDDALKYTGAHEGETDPKEIQDIKDRVISRLAEAYSLEKMRNALNEYKISVNKEREKMKHRKPEEEEEYIFSEEKRVAVPRKQVVDSDREVAEADNNIKCVDRNEKCHEQSYRTPTEILENHFGNKECPAIQAACNEIASAIGQYGQVFKTACNMHEMCLLCSDNSWFSPTRQCNALFLAKAYELCKGNLECQRAAQGSIPYLLDVNRALHTQGGSTDDCELSCPESDPMANAGDTR